MFEAVLCDLDAVLRIWPEGGRVEIERRHGLAAGALFDAAFEPELLHAAFTGAIADEAWRASVGETLAQTYGEAGRAAVAEWSRLRGRLDVEMLGLLRSLRARVRVVLLTNATTRLEADLAELGLVDAFDAVASSARLGLSKPDPACFRAATGLVGASASRCVAIDDQPRHLEGARAAGMTTVHHVDLESTRAALRQLGLLP